MGTVQEIKREHIHSGEVQDCDGKDCPKRAVYKLTIPSETSKHVSVEYLCKSCAEDYEPS